MTVFGKTTLKGKTKVLYRTAKQNSVKKNEMFVRRKLCLNIFGMIAYETNHEERLKINMGL